MFLFWWTPEETIYRGDSSNKAETGHPVRRASTSNAVGRANESWIAAQAANLWAGTLFGISPVFQGFRELLLWGSKEETPVFFQSRKVKSKMTADQSAQGNHQAQPAQTEGAPNTTQLAAAVECLNSQRMSDHAMMEHMQEVILRQQDHLTAHETAARMMAAQWGGQQPVLQQQMSWAPPNGSMGGSQGPLGTFTLPALPGLPQSSVMPQAPAMPQFTQTVVKSEPGLAMTRPVVKQEPQGDAAGFDGSCAAAAETAQVKLERLKQEQMMLGTQMKQEQQNQAGPFFQIKQEQQNQAGPGLQGNLGFVETPTGILGPEGEEMSRTALMEFITQQQALWERYSRQSAGGGNRMVLGRPGFRPGGGGRDSESTAAPVVKATGKKSAWPPHPSKAGYRFYCADESKVKQKGSYAGWRKMESAFPAGESWETLRGRVNGFHTLDEATEWYFANYDGRAQVTIFR